ncbi:hypothetical protein D3218_09110 [Aureimonas flava]|uniref:DUF3606 domain-containing protein n=1 Tax=Aureimonas flava TaxID=2320271 RepID=A0A3A1WNP7_9HYPH|nr:hypothetical protein [Aureimonas flava]RIY01493.1 hypothetical protein D3218_09110 [Aureimonas flava]
MSNTPMEESGHALPDTEAEELAAKHGISLEEAKRHIREQGHSHASKDGAAEAAKMKPPQ